MKAVEVARPLLSRLATRVASGWQASRVRRDLRVPQISWSRWLLIPERVRTSFVCRAAARVDEQARGILEVIADSAVVSDIKNNSEYALSPSAMLTLQQHLAKRGPLRAVECGAGISTLMLASHARQQSTTPPTSPVICTLEHDSSWLETTRQKLLERGLLAYVDLVNAPLQVQTMMGEEIATYAIDFSRIQRVAGEDGFDLALIDGPPGSVGRLGALPVLAPFIADQATVLLDDAYRQPEQSIWRRWLAEYTDQLQFSVMHLTARGMLEATWSR